MQQHDCSQKSARIHPQQRLKLTTQRILSLYRRGKRQKEIVRIMGCKRQWVSFVLRRHLSGSRCLVTTYKCPVCRTVEISKQYVPLQRLHRLGSQEETIIRRLCTMCQDLWRCVRCKQALSRSAISRVFRQQTHSGLCRTCSNEKTKSWRASNRERWNEYQRNHRRERK